MNVDNIQCNIFRAIEIVDQSNHTKQIPNMFE